MMKLKIELVRMKYTFGFFHEYGLGLDFLNEEFQFFDLNDPYVT